MRVVTIAFLMVISNNLFSAESSGPRKILSIGCHNYNSTCYINIDGAPITGATGCSSNSIRWDSQNDINGKSTLALMMMASSTGSKVSIYTQSCYSQQPTYPTILFFDIINN